MKLVMKFLSTRLIASKPAPLIAALVLALSGCTSPEPEVTDRFEVALTAPVPDLDGATIEEEVYARAEECARGSTRRSSCSTHAPRSPASRSWSTWR